MKTIKLSILILLIVVSQSIAQVPQNVRNSIKSIKSKGTVSISMKGGIPENANPIAKTSEWKSKIDPQILRQINSGNNVVSKKSAKQTQSRKEETLKITSSNEVAVFLKLSDNQIPQQGFRVRTVSPDGFIVVGYISLDYLEPIAQLPNVKRIESVKYRKPLLKAGKQAIRADLVQQGLDGLPQAFNGEEVIVGVLDSGLDIRNSDFYNGENDTRVLFLKEFYEEEVDGDMVEKSREWSKAEIDADISSVVQIDGYGAGGHGTHVTGISAGGGKNNAEFTGVAPKANIIFVKGIRDLNSDGGFTDDDVIEGVEYIFSKADELEMPAVVNLSLGGNSGPRDGSSLYEQYLTQLQTNGHIIVAAAGNEGYDFIHTGTEMESGKVYASFEVASNDVEFYKEIWYEKGAIEQYRVVALSTEDLSEVGATDWFGIGTDNEESDLGFEVVDSSSESPAGYVYHSSVDVENENNGDGVIYLYIYDGGAAYIDQYYWSIQYKASSTGGRMDAISSSATSYMYDGITFDGAEFLKGDNIQSVGTPATAKKMVVVGAFVSTNTWTSDETHTVSYPSDPDWEETYQPELGQIAYFSSNGPSRDNRMLPQITAPGDRIFSTRSHDITDDYLESDRLVSNGDYYGLEGTSMATPFVTGSIALMLQVNGSLNSEDVLELFKTTATKDDFTGEGENTTWGYGKLDVMDAIKATINLTTSIEDRQKAFSVELFQNYPNPFNPSTEIRYTLTESAKVSIEVIDVLGRLMMVPVSGETKAAGLNQVQINASSLSSGMYFYRLKADMANGATVVKTKPMMLVK